MGRRSPYSFRLMILEVFLARRDRARSLDLKVCRRRQVSHDGGTDRSCRTGDCRSCPGISGTQSFSLVLVWAIWIACTLVSFLYVRHYARNIPYMDDWAMVPVITGHEPITLKWAWTQHNEHRILVPKLMLAFLFRWVSPDFRTGMYFNAGLMSSAAAMMIVLAHRLRGYQRLTDAVLPLSILTLAQSEVLLIGFALNLVLTAWLAFVLISAFGRATDRTARTTVISLGIALVILPLCGGSGLVMLPPLALWLAGYLCWGWWSGTSPMGGREPSGSLPWWLARPSSHFI